MFNSTRITKLEQQINSIVEINDDIQARIENLENKEDTLSKKLIDVLIEKSNVKIYKVSDVIDTGTPFSLGWTFGYDILFTSDSKFETISIKKLQTIGKYEIFKDEEDTYAIVKNYKKTNKK